MLATSLHLRLFTDNRSNDDHDVGEQMTDRQLLERIACNPKVMVGKPVIKGTRLTVDYVLNLLGHGSTFDAILDEYDGLEREDIQACLLFASRSLSSAAFLPLVAEPA